ncbi:MAG: GNAT family acetyltransferase [Cellvibrionaceae bacterium]
METSVFKPFERHAVVDLWRRCNLIVAWNNPNRDIDRKVAHSPENFWVGYVDGVLIASVMFGYDGHRGSVNYLAIDPAYQGRGYGRQLMEAVEGQMQSWGCPKINLAVRSTNRQVLAFYEALGYKTDPVSSLGKRFEDDDPVF